MILLPVILCNDKTSRSSILRADKVLWNSSNNREELKSTSDITCAPQMLLVTLPVKVLVALPVHRKCY